MSVNIDLHTDTDAMQTVTAKMKKITSPQKTEKKYLQTMLSAAVYLALFFVLFALFSRLFGTINQNADDASHFLEANSFLHGNILLKGWFLSPDTFWTIDTPIDALFIFINGFTITTIVYAESAVYSAIIALSFFLMKRGRPLKDAWLPIAAGMLLLLLPSQELTHYASAIAIHVGTIAYFLAALVIIDKVNIKWLAAILVFFLLLLDALGDPFSLYVFVLPVIAVFFLQWLQSRTIGNALLCSASVAVIPVSMGILRLVTALGGFYTYPSNLTIVNFDGLASNIGLTIQGILLLFGINIWGQPINSALVVESLFRLPILLAVLYFIYIEIKQIRQRCAFQQKTDVVQLILLFALFFTLAAYIFSSYALDLGTTRFLLPVVFLGLIVLGRQDFTAIALNRRTHATILGVCAVGYMVFFIPRLLAPAASPPITPAAVWLEQNGYTSGYGAYWDSAIITLLTSGKVQVTPVQGNNHSIITYYWLDQQSAYSDQSFFLVFASANPPGNGNVDQQNAINTFGTPDIIKNIGKFTILIWNHPITPVITNTPGNS